MARIPSSNRMARILPENKKAQAWAPLCTTAGVLVSATRRSLVADCIARLMEAHIASSTKASFAAVGHNIRAMTDSQSGAGSPFFVEAKGASLGEVYLFGGLQKKDGLLAALGASNVESTRDESKGGLYVTLAKDADCQRVFDVLAMHASVRGPVGYDSNMGVAATLASATFEAPTVEAASTPTEGEAKAPKARKPKATATA